MTRDMHGHYAPATINRSITAIKMAIKLAYKQHRVREDYSQRLQLLPLHNERHVYLSIEQVQALADAASEQVRAAIWIALLTGCRRGEILALKAEDIRKEGLRIVAGNTKTLRERLVPVVPALRPWLAYVPLQLNFEGLKTGFGRARKKAGIDANFHDLRHSCASLLINMGTPLEVVRDVLGHTTIKMTERYAHLQVERQEEALSKLSRLVEITPENYTRKKATCG